MSIRLLDASEAERFRTRINDDPEFRLVGHMSLNLVIDVGGEQRLLKVRDGEVRSIGRFVAMADSADVYIKGVREFWANLLAPLPRSDSGPRHH